MQKNKKANPEDRKVLLGLGFDCDDGQRRITLGKNFRLYGGGKATHGVMRETVIKFNEHLDKKRKTLDELCHDEFYELAERVGLKRFPPDEDPAPQHQ